MEKDFCNKCGGCCKQIPVDFNQRVIYRDGIQPLTTEFEELLKPVGHRDNVTFCLCKFLNNNMCTNPNKLQICKDFPSSPFAFIPDECGYYGEVFIKLETLKQKIRKLKEEIMDYETQLENDKTVQKLIDHHKAFINKYAPYGSENW